MIKKTLYFGNPAYLSLRMEQMVIKLPEVEKAENIPELIKAGIKSLKIEGRAKSAYYVSIITNAYKQALNTYFKMGEENYKLPCWIK